MRRLVLLSSVALFAMMSRPAGAQTTHESPDQPAEPASSTSASDQRSPEQGTEIQDIIVTAQRFEQTAQKTPLVITTLSTKDLTGVSDVRQLQAVSPGIQLAAAGNVVQTYIRGVGTQAATNQQESAVAYNVDGVFLFTSTMITPLMYDLERVEVLKGPQGTLYGRNASGGAVNLITTGAALGVTSGYVEAEAGNYDLRRVTGAINLPISQSLALRVAGQHVEHSGYLSDGSDDADITSGRARLLWEAAPDVTLKVGVDVARTGGRGAGASINPNPTSEKYLGGTDPRAQTGSPFVGGTSLLSATPNPQQFFRDHQWSANAQLDVGLGFATLTVLPAYRYESVRSLSYVPGYEYSETSRSKQTSIETRLANRSHRIKWVAGAYYFKLNQHYLQGQRNETNFQSALNDAKGDVESYAFFGEATYSLTDRWRLIGGLRYTHEETSTNGFVNASLGSPAIVNPITGLPNVQTSAFNPFNAATNPTGELLDYYVTNGSKANAVTWKGGTEFDLSPSSMLFFTASRGFKGGGTYIDYPTSRQSFKPEYLTAFELGSRNRFFDNRLQLNFEGFYWKLKDQQVPYVGFNTVGAVAFITQNAGKAHMYGGSVDLIYKLTPSDTIHLGGEFVHSKYDEFTRVVPSLAAMPTTACRLSGYDPTPGSLAPATLNCAGLPLLRTPKFSASADYTHRFDLGDHGAVVVDGNATYSSGRYLDPSYTSLLYQKRNAVLGLRISYEAPQDRYEVTFWMQNITNNRVMSGGGQFFPFYARPTLLPPRTVGGSVRFKF